MDVLNNFSVVADVQCEGLEHFVGTATCSEDSRYFAFITRRSIFVLDFDSNVEMEYKSQQNLSCIKMKPDGKYL